MDKLTKTFSKAGGCVVQHELLIAVCMSIIHIGTVCCTHGIRLRPIDRLGLSSDGAI